MATRDTATKAAATTSGTATRTTHPKVSARERLLESANELFYREGVHSVGIDRVIEHAGVAKASLYNTFGSKEELVHAYLLGRQATTTARVTAAVEAQTTPRAKVLAIFDSQAESQRRPGFRRGDAPRQRHRRAGPVVPQ
jgi:AcrR family transcriptional regulator